MLNHLTEALVIMSIKEAAAYKTSCTLAKEPNGALPENVHAFEDLTDFQVSVFI
jgi:hypothetical protein